MKLEFRKNLQVKLKEMGRIGIKLKFVKFQIKKS
jgi:hypothetical protein